MAEFQEVCKHLKRMCERYGNMSDAIVSYSPYCMHCLDVTKNEIGETVVFCEEWDLWRNVTLGDCFGNCEDQIVADGKEPLEWIEPKEE